MTISGRGSVTSIKEVKQSLNINARSERNSHCLNLGTGWWRIFKLNEDFLIQIIQIHSIVHGCNLR